MISTQSPLPRTFSVIPSPEIVPLSCRLLPKLSTQVDCCLGWGGGAALASVLRVDGHPSPSHRRRPIVLVAISPLSSDRCRRRHPRRVPLPHRCCRHRRHHCCWRRCLRCRRHHRHRRSSSSCLSCSLAVNPRNSTKASQGGIAHGMGMECLPLDLP